ncbi:hypothetical protein BJX70DRAFT_360948 [Aspergillus crustosus]
MTGDQRADYVSVNPDNGRLTLWHNRCWPLPDDNEGGDDDDDDDDDNGGTSPDPVEQDNWEDLDCSAHAVTDAGFDPEWRWNELLCPQAWFYCIERWHEREDQAQHMSFSREVSNFLRGGEKMECGNLEPFNNCHDTNQCLVGDRGAASFMIMNSFISISQTLYNLYDAMKTAADDVEGSIGRFSETFAPIIEDGLNILVILDIVALGYGSVMAPFWNKWAKNWKWSKDNSNDYDTMKDFTNDMTYQGITLAKDLVNDNPLSIQNALSEQLSALVISWRQTNRDYAKQLFNGSSSSVDRLGKIIANGKMVGPDSPPDVEDVVTAFKKSLYALLVPQAWRISEQKLNPFVIDTGLSCKDAPKDTDHELRLDEDTLKEKLICDKKADRAYYLVGAVDPEKNCWHGSNTGGYGCEHFADLPGADKLTGDLDKSDGYWGLVSREDIVFGSLATFKANGNKNMRHDTETEDWKSPDEWESLLGDLADGDIRAPYFFNLPVCRVNEALSNYFSPPGNPEFYYPCNEKIDWNNNELRGNRLGTLDGVP